MASLGSFELDIAKFVAKANGNATLVVRKISLDLFSRVIEKTPIDTGRLSGSWVVAIDSIPADDPATLGPDSSIARVEIAVLDMKAGDNIAMVSNLDYARSIEFGHSKQAPAGMVRISVAEFPLVVQTAVESVPK